MGTHRGRELPEAAARKDGIGAGCQDLDRQGKEATGPWVGGMGGMSSLFDFWHLIPQVNPCQFSQGAGKLFAGTQGESMLSLLMSKYSFQKLEI